MNKAWSPILWAAAYMVLLVALLSPLLFLAAPMLLIPPIVIMSTQTRLKSGVLLGAAIAGATLLWPVSLSTVLIGLFMLLPAAMMARLFQRQAPARNVVAAGLMCLIGIMLIGMLIGLLNGNNFVAILEDNIREQVKNLPQDMQKQLNDTVGLNAFIDLLVDSIPVVMIFLAAWFVIPAYTLSRRMLVRSGLPVQGFPPMREWMLPKSLVWYYLIAMILELVLAGDGDSIWHVAATNLIPLLMVAFAVQGIAFLTFVTHIKGRSRLLPITIAIITVLFFPLMIHFTSLLGVFDVAFPIRRSMTEKK